MNPPSPAGQHDVAGSLARHPFFAELSEPELLQLAGCAGRREFPAGHALIQEGQPAHSFYALIHGKVAIQLHLPVRGLVTLQTIADGEVLGWSWLAPSGQWTFDARTLQPTVALEFDGPAVLQLCEAEPRLGYRLMVRLARVMTQRLHATRLQLLDIYGTPRK